MTALCTIHHCVNRPDATCWASEVQFGDVLNIMNTRVTVSKFEYDPKTGVRIFLTTPGLNNEYVYCCAPNDRLVRVENVPYDGSILVSANFTITAQMICDLIVTAIEAPSGEWIGSAESRGGKGWTYIPGSGVEYGQVGFYQHEGWSIVFTHEAVDGVEGTYDSQTILTAARCEAALTLMADAHHPRAWSELVTDNMDSDTADVFMQYACFGEIVFG